MMIPVTWHFFSTFLSGKIPCCMHPMYSQHKHAPEKHFFSSRCWYVTLALPIRLNYLRLSFGYGQHWKCRKQGECIWGRWCRRSIQISGQQNGDTATCNSNICEGTGVRIYNGEYTKQVGVSIILSCVAFRPVWLS